MNKKYVQIAFSLVVGSLLIAVTGCGSLYNNGQLDNDPPNTLVDECFVFDCNSGAFGGVIQWCTDNYRAFDDCP